MSLSSRSSPARLTSTAPLPSSSSLSLDYAQSSDSWLLDLYEGMKILAKQAQTTQQQGTDNNAAASSSSSSPSSTSTALAGADFLVDFSLLRRSSPSFFHLVDSVRLVPSGPPSSAFHSILTPLSSERCSRLLSCLCSQSVSHLSEACLEHVRLKFIESEHAQQLPLPLPLTSTPQTTPWQLQQQRATMIQFHEFNLVPKLHRKTWFLLASLYESLLPTGFQSSADSSFSSSSSGPSSLPLSVVSAALKEWFGMGEQALRKLMHFLSEVAGPGLTPTAGTGTATAGTAANNNSNTSSATNGAVGGKKPFSMHGEVSKLHLYLWWSTEGCLDYFASCSAASASALLSFSSSAFSSAPLSKAKLALPAPICVGSFPFFWEVQARLFEDAKFWGGANNNSSSAQGTNANTAAATDANNTNSSSSASSASFSSSAPLHPCSNTDDFSLFLSLQSGVDLISFMRVFDSLFPAQRSYQRTVEGAFMRRLAGQDSERRPSSASSVSSAEKRSTLRWSEIIGLMNRELPTSFKKRIQYQIHPANPAATTINMSALSLSTAAASSSPSPALAAAASLASSGFFSSLSPRTDWLRRYFDAEEKYVRILVSHAAQATKKAQMNWMEQRGGIDWEKMVRSVVNNETMGAASASSASSASSSLSCSRLISVLHTLRLVSRALTGPLSLGGGCGIGEHSDLDANQWTLREFVASVRTQGERENREANSNNTKAKNRKSNGTSKSNVSSPTQPGGGGVLKKSSSSKSGLTSPSALASPSSSLSDEFVATLRAEQLLTTSKLNEARAAREREREKEREAHRSHSNSTAASSASSSPHKVRSPPQPLPHATLSSSTSSSSSSSTPNASPSPLGLKRKAADSPSRLAALAAHEASFPSSSSSSVSSSSSSPPQSSSFPLSLPSLRAHPALHELQRNVEALRAEMHRDQENPAYSLLQHRPQQTQGNNNNNNNQTDGSTSPAFPPTAIDSLLPTLGLPAPAMKRPIPDSSDDDEDGYDEPSAYDSHRRIGSPAVQLPLSSPYPSSLSSSFLSSDCELMTAMPPSALAVAANNTSSSSNDPSSPSSSGRFLTQRPSGSGVAGHSMSIDTQRSSADGCDVASSSSSACAAGESSSSSHVLPPPSPRYPQRGLHSRNNSLRDDNQVALLAAATNKIKLQQEQEEEKNREKQQHGDAAFQIQEEEQFAQTLPRSANITNNAPSSGSSPRSMNPSPSPSFSFPTQTTSPFSFASTTLISPPSASKTLDSTIVSASTIAAASSSSVSSPPPVSSSASPPAATGRAASSVSGGVLSQTRPRLSSSYSFVVPGPGEYRIPSSFSSLPALPGRKNYTAGLTLPPKKALLLGEGPRAPSHTLKGPSLGGKIPLADSTDSPGPAYLLPSTLSPTPAASLKQGRQAPFVPSFIENPSPAHYDMEQYDLVHQAAKDAVLHGPTMGERRVFLEIAGSNAARNEQ